MKSNTPGALYAHTTNPLEVPREGAKDGRDAEEYKRVFERERDKSRSLLVRS
jgi:hypothetical protein